MVFRNLPRGVREAQILYLLCSLHFLSSGASSPGEAAASVLRSALPALAVLGQPQNAALIPLLLVAAASADRLVRGGGGYCGGAGRAWVFSTLGYAFFFYQVRRKNVETTLLSRMSFQDTENLHI